MKSTASNLKRKINILNVNRTEPAYNMGLPQFGHDQVTSTVYRFQSSAMGATV